MKNVINENGNIVKKKSKILATICVIVGVIVLLTLLTYVLVRAITGNNKDIPSANKLYTLWKAENYQGVYDVSSILLEKNPLNNTAVAFKGYSAFFLALSQTETSISQTYLDEAINNLRIASYYSGKDTLPQIYYMLGKAYFQKNNISSYHYYSDLAIKYLELAKSKGYVSADIPEYLGLCYADLGYTNQSLAAFTDALLLRESDVLLLAIAQQYLKNSQTDIAKQYLFRVNYESKNDDIILKSKLLLADIYLLENNYEAAEKEYTEVLNKDPTIADAYYGMGNIYEKSGDIAKARSEWRKALKMQVNHTGAIKKLGL